MTDADESGGDGGGVVRGWRLSFEYWFFVVTSVNLVCLYAAALQQRACVHSGAGCGGARWAVADELYTFAA